MVAACCCPRRVDVVDVITRRPCAESSKGNTMNGRAVFRRTAGGAGWPGGSRALRLGVRPAGRGCRAGRCCQRWHLAGGGSRHPLACLRPRYIAVLLFLAVGSVLLYPYRPPRGRGFRRKGSDHLRECARSARCDRAAGPGGPSGLGLASARCAPCVVGVVPTIPLAGRRGSNRGPVARRAAVIGCGGWGLPAAVRKEGGLVLLIVMHESGTWRVRPG